MVKHVGFVVALICLLLTACNPIGSAIFVKVTSDDGSPVAGATVTYNWSTGEEWTDGPSHEIHHTAVAVTDADGLAHAEITSDYSAAIDVVSPNFYGSFVSVVGGGSLLSHATSFTALPIPLERVIAPRPLIAKSAWVTLPSLSGDCGYDFLAGDLVAPVGTGTKADCEIRWSSPLTNSGIRQRTLYDIVFPDPTDGILARNVSTDRTVVESFLRSERSAPSTGYVSSMRKSEAMTGPAVAEGKGDQEIIYYFCVTRNASRLYGKILGEPQINFYHENSHPVIKFIYAINPSGDLSLEPELNSNKFPQINGYEQPYRLPEPD